MSNGIRHAAYVHQSPFNGLGANRGPTDNRSMSSETLKFLAPYVKHGDIMWHTPCGIHHVAYIVYYTSYGMHHVADIMWHTSCGIHYVADIMWQTSCGRWFCIVSYMRQVTHDITPHPSPSTMFREIITAANLACLVQATHTALCCS